MDKTTSRSERWTLPVVFVLTAAFLVFRAVQASATVPLFADTDDAMRMVVVHDLLAGQNWFDHLQHRLNTPFGADIHWSRLVDLPIAGLLLVLRPLFGASADMIAGYVYPLTLLLVLLLLLAHLARRLIGPEGVLAAVVLPLLTPSVISEFTPGRMDHHSIQILLILALLAATLAALERPRAAILAGVIAATSLAIGTEAITLVAAAILTFGLFWVFAENKGAALRNFGIAFGGAALIHLAIYLPPSRWLEPACDALSIVYVLAATGTGLGFALLSLLPLRQSWQRLLVGAVVGAALVAGLVLAYPDCLKGPYAGLDPWLVANWLDRITEVEPLINSLKGLDPFGFGLAVPLALAALALMMAIRGAPEKRLAWSVAALFFAAALAVALFQIRGGRLAMPLAIVPLAWLIATARRRYLAKGTMGRAIRLIGAWLGAAGLITALILAAYQVWRTGETTPGQPAANNDRSCLLPGNFADLAGLPPERVLSPIDMGAHLLLNTDHAVVGAPYHRNQRGVRDVFAFLNEPLESQRAMLAERGIGLIVTCADMPEMRVTDMAEPGSFVRLFPNSLPDWLVDQSLGDSPIRVFAVLPARP
jgi:hypothetical protein